jgi:tetratricopeptide (TPR) repeat protein
LPVSALTDRRQDFEFTRWPNERLAPKPHLVRPLPFFAVLSKRRLSYAQGYLELGMLAEAGAELDRITGPEAGRSEVLAVRLAVYQEQQNWAAARETASELVRRNPAAAATWVTWAYATRRAASLEAAEEILLQGEDLHPREPTIKFNLACYACQRGDLALARLRLRQAIALDDKFALLAETDPDLAPLRHPKVGPDCQPGA